MSGSASPAAITAADSKSMRPRLVALSSAGLPLGSRRSDEFATAVANASDSRIASRPVSTSRCNALTSLEPSCPPRHGGTHRASAVPPGPGSP